MPRLKILEAILKFIGKVLSPFRRIPVVDNWLRSLQQRWLNPVVTQLIRDSDDPDLPGALDLYRKRLPEEHRVAEDDMVRWIREDAERRRRDANPILTDWFIVQNLRVEARYLSLEGANHQHTVLAQGNDVASYCDK